MFYCLSQGIIQSGIHWWKSRKWSVVTWLFNFSFLLLTKLKHRVKITFLGPIASFSIAISLLYLNCIFKTINCYICLVEFASLQDSLLRTFYTQQAPLQISSHANPYYAFLELQLWNQWKSFHIFLLQKDLSDAACFDLVSSPPPPRCPIYLLQEANQNARSCVRLDWHFKTQRKAFSLTAAKASG